MGLGLPWDVMLGVVGWVVTVPGLDPAGIVSVQAVGKWCPTSWGLRVTQLVVPNVESI